MKCISLEDREAENLLAYLERLVCYPETPKFNTKIIREEVLSLMRKVELQAGVCLSDTNPVVSGTTKSQHTCVMRNKVCLICGVTTV